MLSELSVNFAEDFARRREMVLCRLGATRHCFANTPKGQQCGEKLEAMYAQKALELCGTPIFTADDVSGLSAGNAGALLLSSVTSANLIRQFKMAGKVPDRGKVFECMLRRAYHAWR